MPTDRARPQPVVLEGRGMRLEPLAPGHVDALLAAAADGELWRLHYTSVPGPGRDEVAAYVDAALRGRDDGHMLPFAVVGPSGDVVGSTRYCNIDAAVPRLEIGYTWYARRCQRTVANTACKRLLLAHAFDAIGAVAVEFRTSHLNLASQAAIERLGARRDGVLRRHMRHRDGSLRDTVVYSILADDWPEVRDRLDVRLAAGR